MLALLAALLFLIAAISGEAGDEFVFAPGTWLALGLLALAVQIALADAYVARRVQRRQPPQ